MYLTFWPERILKGKQVMAILRIRFDRKTGEIISETFIESDKEPNWTALADAYIGAFINTKEDTPNDYQSISRNQVRKDQPASLLCRNGSL